LYLRRSLTQHITDQLDVKVVIYVMVWSMRLSATGSLRDQMIAILLFIQSRRSKNKLLMKAGCADMVSIPVVATGWMPCTVA